MIQKLPSLAFPIPNHRRNSRNDQETKSLIPYYKKIIPIPPSFFCTLLLGVSVFSFFIFSPFMSPILTMTSTKETRLRIHRCCHHQYVVSNESRDKKKSPDKCPWPRSVHVFLILAPGLHRPPFVAPHAARLGACGGPLICFTVSGEFISAVSSQIPWDAKPQREEERV